MADDHAALFQTMNVNKKVYMNFEWWAANAVAPGEQLGVRCLAQGSHLSRGKVERALVIHSPHRQFLLDLRLEPTTFKLQD